VIDFQCLVKAETRQDQSIREQALSPSRCFVHTTREQEIVSRSHRDVSKPPLRSIERRERCFRPFAWNGRDHDGQPEGRTAQP
jgi:hypothetical protein